MKPDEDIYYAWNEGDGTPHYTRIDEFPSDDNGDGGNIRETSVGASDRWKFNGDDLTIPTGHQVSKVIMKGLVTKKTSACTAWISVSSTAGSGTWSPSTSGTTYSWKSIIKTGLNIDQAALNEFYINVKPNNIPPNIPDCVLGWVDIECVYVEVYTSPDSTYDLDVEVDIKVDDLDCSEILSLEFSYTTDITATINFEIWNWDIEEWDQIESDDSFILGKDSVYVSDEFEVRIRFQSFDQSNDFDLQIDCLRVDYITT